MVVVASATRTPKLDGIGSGLNLERLQQGEDEHQFVDSADYRGNERHWPGGSYHIALAVDGGCTAVSTDTPPGMVSKIEVVVLGLLALIAALALLSRKLPVPYPILLVAG